MRIAIVGYVLAAAVAACTAALPNPTAQPATTDTPTTTVSTAATTPTAELPRTALTATAAASTAAPSPAAPESLYAGRLFDTHIHTQSWAFGGASAETVLRYLSQEGTDWAVGLFKLSAAGDASTGPTTTLIQGTRGRMVALLRPWTPGEGSGASIDFAQGKFTDAVLKRYLRPAGPLRGLGEINHNRKQLQTIAFDGPEMDVALRAVNEMKGAVVIHPSGVPTGRAVPLREYETAIGKYPDVRFVFHGSAAAFDVVQPLMVGYPNVYFTWDTQLMLQGPWQPHNLMYPAGIGGGGSAQQFEADLERVGMQKVLLEALGAAVPRFRKHPDRVMWGTDRAQPWHFDERARDRIIEISRRFIARLPEELREPYASGNALRVFGDLLGR